MAKEEKEPWLLDLSKLSLTFFYLLVLFLPTQLGKHFFPEFAFVYGLRIDYLSPTIYLTDIFVFLIFIFSVKKITEIIISKYKKQVLCFTLFFISLFLGIYVAKNSPTGYYSILKLLEYFYLGAFVYLNFKKINKNKLVVCLISGILFESILAIIQYFNQGSLQNIFYFLGERKFNPQTPGIANASINGRLILRPYGTFSHPNVLAGYLCLFSIFFLFLKSKINKYLILIILTFATFGIFISLSRTVVFVWMLFMITVFIFTIVEKYKKDKLNRNNISWKLLILVVIICLIITNLNLANRFLLPNFSDESLVQRGNLISQSIKMIQKNPILGVGMNNFLNNLEPDFNTPLLIQPVHNIFLLIFSQTGIIGISVFIFLLVNVFKNIIYSKRFNIYKMMIFVAIVLIGTFDHYLFTSQQGQLILAILFPYCLSRIN